MTPIRRRVAAVSAAVLLALSLTACGGGGSSAPEDATAEEFCSAYTEGLFEALGEIDQEAQADEQAEQLIDVFQTWADELGEVGTPEDMPAEAREGFEVTLEQVEDLDEGEVADALESENFDDFGDISEGDQEKIDALEEYSSENCESPLGELPTDVPTQ